MFDYTKYLNLVTNYEYEDSGYHCKSIPLKPNTQYRVSFPTKETTSTILLLNNKSHINDAGFLDTRNASGNKSFTTDNTGNLYIGVLYSNDSTINDLLENLKLQVEEGSTATSYVPHQEQNYPFTFAGGQFLADDEELQDNGLYKEWKKKVFDGTENWLTFTLEGKTRYYINIADGTGTNAKCSHFICQTSGGFPDVNKFIYNGDTNKNMIFYKGDTENKLTEWKAYLAEQYANGTPVEVEYKMEQPEIIPYNSTQQAQYNAIKNAETYKDITYIRGLSDELAPELKIQYWKERGTEE